ncbi:MAG TPA: ABC transporter ATP-binding protein [Thermoanaerobaculia bacterium]
MKNVLALPLGVVREKPGLASLFAVASLGRAAMASGSILLIHRLLVERSSFWLYVGLLLVAQLGGAGIAYVAKIAEQRLVTRVEFGTMERVIRHIVGLSSSFFDRRTHGDLVQSVRQDVTNVRMVTVAVAEIVLQSVHVLGLVVAAVMLSVSLSTFVFLFILVAIVPIAFIARRTLTHSYGVRGKSVAVFDMLLQLLHGVRIMKVYRAEDAEAERTVGRARGYFDELVNMERGRALARVALDSLTGLSMVAVVIAGGLEVQSGRMNWPELLAFLMAARAVHGPLAAINASFMDIQRHGASVANVEALLSERAEVCDAPDARPLPHPPSVISVRDLGFAVGEMPILRNVSFHVRAGETLGVVGPSGAGKSTLVNLAARLYDPTSGAVLFDGIDLRRFRLADVHDKIAIVTQDPFLFTTSIRDNIRRGRPEATDAEIEDAARAAEIHDDIAAMPDGYDTIVGHGGRALSRGEAQRVNIARAILKNAPILLLDEATSSLDSYAEARVQRAVDRLVSGRLAISVAHRLSTLRNATRILVLENGSVAGLGTHAELLESCATYQRLWQESR